ncbi:hypothetical protein FQR65_LT09875 [Abscondita terminalis]|nr:hypothetical protein FQR65_LT09875 [Abscondita terminalis]
MYSKLEHHLQGLKALKLEPQDPTTWIFPLVELSLPDNVLPLCQFSTDSQRDGLKEEPEKDSDKKENSFSSRQERKEKNDIPATAFSLLQGEANLSCIFCGNAYATENYGKESDMSLEEKDRIIEV